MAKAEHPGSEKWVVTTSELAELFNVSERAVRKWPDAGCPKRGRGKWDLPDVIAWKMNSFVTDGTVDSEKLREREAVADVVWKEKRARQKEIECSILEGQYLPKEKVLEEWLGRIAEVKARLGNLPRMLAGKLILKEDQEEIVSIIEDEVRNVCEAFCRGGTYTPSGSGSSLDGTGDRGMETGGKADDFGTCE